MKRIGYLFTFVMLLSLSLTGCTTIPAATPTAAPAVTAAPATSTTAPAATSESGNQPTVVAATTVPGGPGTLTVMTHDSFSISEGVLAKFQSQCGCTVQFLKSGDAGLALNKAILSKNNPLADVFYGVDNTFLSRALAADIFEPYASPNLDQIPAELRVDPSNRELPVDYGYVAINYDRKYFSDNGIALPATLKDLTNEAYKSLLVVENPATSSPGLAFLMATVATFGETGSYTYLDFWRDLRKNDVLVSEGWEDAYNAQFSAGSGKGDRPMVASYATSPAAEVYFADPQPPESPTGNLFLPGSSFKQIEFVGILKGAKHSDLARQWIDFMLGDTFQADIPLQMWVYPAREGVPLPEVFTKYAQVPTNAVNMMPEQIEAGRDRWIKAWTDVMLR
jgi:thiamine transport system substrate-binding protein